MCLHVLTSLFISLLHSLFPITRRKHKITKTNQSIELDVRRPDVHFHQFFYPGIKENENVSGEQYVCSSNSPP